MVGVGRPQELDLLTSSYLQYEQEAAVSGGEEEEVEGLSAAKEVEGGGEGCRGWETANCCAAAHHSHCHGNNLPLTVQQQSSGDLEITKYKDVCGCADCECSALRFVHAGVSSPW